jgi:hypothetical protein
VALGDSLLSDWELLRGHAVAILGGNFRELLRCGSLANSHRDVGVFRHRGGHLAFEGVRYCSRIWVCPVCSRIVVRGELRQLLRLWATVRAEGGRPATFCLTAGYPQDMPLADRVRRLVASFGRLTGGRYGIHQQYRGQGLLGFFRSIEMNYSLKTQTWQPHLHGVVFFQGSVPPSFRSWLERAWDKALALEGLSGVGGITVDDEFENEKAAVAYVCQPMDASEPGAAAVSLSPFQVLRASTTGEVEYIAAFRDYAQATKGLHYLSYSHGLLNRLEQFQGKSGVTRQQGRQLDALSSQDYKVLLAGYRISLHLAELNRKLSGKG